MAVGVLEATVVSGWSYAAIITEEDGRVLVIGTCVFPTGAAAYALASENPRARVVKLAPEATQLLFDLIVSRGEELDDDERESIGMACERALEREEC